VIVAILAVVVSTRSRAARRARLNCIVANSGGGFLDEDFLMGTRGA
jgi:hypothetical protein